MSISKLICEFESNPIENNVQKFINAIVKKKQYRENNTQKIFQNAIELTLLKSFELIECWKKKRKQKPINKNFNVIIHSIQLSHCCFFFIFCSNIHEQRC